MNPSLASPTPLVSSRRTWARLWNDPDSRSVVIGILGMLLVHLLLFLFAPYLLQTERGPNVLRPHANPQQFNIELAPDEVVAPPKPPAPFKFVEANPDANDNRPDKTENFAAQNQQVAQLKPTPNGQSDRPAMEGQKEIHSTQIVSGQLTKVVERMPVAPPVEAPPTQVTQQAPRQEQNPLSGFEKKVGDDENGFGSNIAKQLDGAKAAAEQVEGVKHAAMNDAATAMQPQIDPLRPRPRPQVVKQQQVRPAIFEENKVGTQNVGLTGVSAQFSSYGQYLQKMVETIQLQWELLLYESKVAYTAGTSVRVTFRMNPEGGIYQIVEVEGTAGNQFEKICATAITARSPYGAWTDDMKAVLGESQEMTFTFYYQ